ncbi:MAG: glycosyltransferase family 39 protein [Candidatus Roizmanbacteria bacterium]|nr:glycosyltransferase family 39 protein [Candidatus Roizmanbacteria bacterium]
MNGENPSLLNPEHPPLAKYLIGYSIQTFGNEHMVGMGIAFLSLVLVGVISFQLYGSLLFSSFAVLLTSLFPLFTDQIINGPQLELYQLFFFLLTTFFLLLLIKKKKTIYSIGVGISFGLLLSTKTLLPFLLLFSTWLVISLWKKWKELFLIFLLGAITFTLTYFSFFMQGGTLRTFLGLQKYIVTYYGHSGIPYLEFLGNDLRLIFTGSWKFWDTNRTVSVYSEWNLLWPIIFLVGIYKLKIQWTKYHYSHFIIWFIILYNIFVFIVPVFPRYLLLLFVPLIILI